MLGMKQLHSFRLFGQVFASAFTFGRVLLPLAAKFSERKT